MRKDLQRFSLSNTPRSRDRWLWELASSSTYRLHDKTARQEKTSAIKDRSIPAEVSSKSLPPRHREISERQAGEDLDICCKQKDCVQRILLSFCICIRHCYGSNIATGDVHYKGLPTMDCIVTSRQARNSSIEEPTTTHTIFNLLSLSYRFFYDFCVKTH